jgi:hypothetical protein
MMDRLNQFFGQDSTRQQDYQDFSQRYQQDPQSIPDAEAARRYRELAEQLDDDDLDEAHEQGFSQLAPQQRRQLAEGYQRATQDPNRPYQGYPQDQDLDQAAQPRELGRMTRRASREDPDLLEQLVGEGSPLASTGGKLAMAGAAAFLANRFLSGKR